MDPGTSIRKPFDYRRHWMGADVMTEGETGELLWWKEQASQLPPDARMRQAGYPLTAFWEKTTSKPKELGVLELWGRWSSIACSCPLWATFVRLASEHQHSAARKIPCFSQVGCQGERQVDRKTQGKDEGTPSVLLDPCSVVQKSSFQLVYVQNKCQKSMRQNWMKDAYNCRVWWRMPLISALGKSSSMSSSAKTQCWGYLGYLTRCPPKLPPLYSMHMLHFAGSSAERHLDYFNLLDFWIVFLLL